MSNAERFFSPPEIGAPGREIGRRQRRDLVVAGVFVILMLVMLVLGLMMISGSFGRTYKIYTHCSTSGGIEAGTEVQQAGYAVGKVLAVAPQFEGVKPSFKIELGIDRNWIIPDTGKVVIGSDGILAGNVIKLVPGRIEKAEALRPGSELNCEKEADIVARVTAIMDQTVAPILESVRKQIEALEALMVTGEGGAGSQQTIAGILENLRDISQDLKAQTHAIQPGHVAAIVSSARSAASNVERITHTLTQRTQEIDKSVRDFGALAERLNAMVEKNDPKIERSLSDTQFMLQELANAMTPILNNLDQTTRNLKELSMNLRDNPSTILWGPKGSNDDGAAPP